MEEDSPQSSQERTLENVQYLRSLIDKFVTIQVLQNCTYTGFLNCIDPVSKSVILSIPTGESFTATLLLGHAVLNITETPSTTEKRPERKVVTSLDDAEVLERKMKILAWLKKKLLPVTEKNNIIDLGNVSILPPYGLNDISTDNPVVVLEIRKLIEGMPEDFVP